MKLLQILVLILGFAVCANAQKAVLSGAVYDANGSLIVGAKVIAKNEKGEMFETVTNDEGIYVLNLPFNQYNSKADFKIAKYDITVEQKHFEKILLKGFNFVPSYEGKMILDMALDVEENANCGAGGCIQDEHQPIELSNQKVTDKILLRPLEELPKKINKAKRKN
jgi:hypothetical protein